MYMYRVRSFDFEMSFTKLTLQKYSFSKSFHLFFILPVMSHKDNPLNFDKLKLAEL